MMDLLPLQRAMIVCLFARLLACLPTPKQTLLLWGVTLPGQSHHSQKSKKVVPPLTLFLLRLVFVKVLSRKKNIHWQFVFENTQLGSYHIIYLTQE